MSALRDLAKRFAPRGLVRKLEPLRDFLNGPGIETYVLRDYGFRADDTTRPRLTLIIPSLSAKEAFGGVTTCLDVLEALADQVDADIRILTEAAYDPADCALGDAMRARTRVESLAGDFVISTRQHEMFIAYNWWISINIEPVIGAQSAHFNQPRLPKIYLMQEYEPHFYEFSSAHLYANYAFNNSGGPMWGIFNASEFHAFYKMQGNQCDQAFVFEPRMAPRIRAFADDLKAEEKKRKILVYGRPGIPRNCFTILKAGLELWARDHGAGKDWEIVSAGMKHADIDLGNGHAIRSLGKLSLEEYGTLLRETSVGISLMASPHPSYPPLEMAHFGIRTISNAYACKDLTKRHENITSLADILPRTLAMTLAEEIAAAETDPGAALRAQSHMPDYLSDAPIDCIASLAGAIAGVFVRS